MKVNSSQTSERNAMICTQHHNTIWMYGDLKSIISSEFLDHGLSCMCVAALSGMSFSSSSSPEWLSHFQPHLA